MQRTRRYRRILCWKTYPSEIVALWVAGDCVALRRNHGLDRNRRAGKQAFVPVRSGQPRNSVAKKYRRRRYVMMRTRRMKAVVLFVLLVSVVHISIAPVRAEPITVGVVLITIGTGVVVGIAANEFNANYVNIAHAYATPQPDSRLVWTIGRGNPASAYELDPGPGSLDSVGAACAEAGFIYDTVEAEESCFGIKAENDYYNAARIYKNGQVNENAVEGTPAAGDTQDLRLTLINLPARQDVRIDMHTGKISSLDALVGGGARFTGSTWVPWRSTEETDQVVRSYLSGALSPDAGSEVPSFIVPSVDDLFAADDASGAVDWFPFFLSAVSSAGTFERNGQTFYNDISFDVPLSQVVPLDGTWYTSVEVLQPNVNAVPEPAVTILLFSIGIAMLAGSRILILIIDKHLLCAPRVFSAARDASVDLSVHSESGGMHNYDDRKSSPCCSEAGIRLCL